MILEICVEWFDFCYAAGRDDRGQYTVFCSKKVL